MLATVYSGSLTKKTVFNQIVDYHYKRWYYNIGDFELTVLDTDPGEPWHNVNPGDILYVYDDENGDDSLYITTVTAEKGRIKFSGYDLKIILNWRITLFPTKELEAGTYGYDCRTGYTGDIIKGYIDYNLCQASDPQRRLTDSYCTTDAALGLSDDTYMSRLQPLNEVVEALCGNAGIGYKVTLDPFSLKYIINIFEGTDRRREIGFGTYIGNADSVKKIRDNTSERSTAWAVNGTGVKDSTVTAVQLSDSAEWGISRKETTITINCDTDQVSVYAKHSAGDYKETEEIDASVSIKGMTYDVGDIVVVHDDMGGVTDMRIMAIEKEYSGCKLRKMLHFVDYQVPKSREKVLTKLAAAESTAKKDIVDQKLDGGEADASGVNIANAIVITEDDAKNIIHNFTQTKYIDGNKIGYSGPDENIIVQGYVLHRYTTSGIDVNINNSDGTYNDEDGSKFAEAIKDYRFYTTMPLKDAFYYFDSDDNYDITKIETRYVSWDSTYTNYALELTKKNGTAVKLKDIETRNAAGAPNGIAIVYNQIYAPGETLYGYSSDTGFVNAYVGYKIAPYSNGTVYRRRFSILTTRHILIPFASETEYNAAVGLTYEPLQLVAVNDNPQSKKSDGITLNTTINTGSSYVSPTVDLTPQTGGVQLTVTDVLGVHTYFIPDGSSVTKTSQLTNDSGFVVRKSGVPYNVIAVPGANSAVLVWEKVTGAAKYRIQRLNNGTWGTIAYPTANSYRATGLTAGTEYAYRVLASVDGTTWGSASEAAYVTPFSVVSATSISEISETPSDEFEGEEVTTI